MNDNNPWAIINKGAHKTKSNKVVMTKQKFDIKSKTKKCSFCDMPGTRLKFGNVTRTLCKDHLKQLNAKHEKYTVTSDTFVKASKL